MRVEGSLTPTPATAPADLGQRAAVRATGAADPFAQLLAMSSEMTEAFPDAAQGDPSALFASSASAGYGTSQLDQVLTFTLLRVLERLIDTQAEPANAAVGSGQPGGLPVSGRMSQDYHAGHHGIDLAVPVGTPVRSTMAGRVAYAGWNTEGYGNLVIVENGAYRTYYAHLSALPVQAGQTVSAGDLIGLSGNTGNSTGPHVHYEVRVNGQPVRPEPAA